jgi:hypothetical protein
MMIKFLRSLQPMLFVQMIIFERVLYLWLRGIVIGQEKICHFFPEAPKSKGFVYVNVLVISLL